ncbi:hypothetical protein ACJVC5_00565 [Peredibacter sp. HCB2-198]|uniref:hypothetical protein n=1 Tax=Peredibacter sp. HCB2-198 TaxID=3383025 RepID=UPI0038B5B4C3
MKKIICLLLCLSFVLPSAAFAQEDDLIKNTQNDLILVGAAGVGGAILGLSTLSFVDKPSQHVSNIWTGAAIGVILGVIWVAYDSVQRNQDDLTSSVEFNSSERVAWHAENAGNLTLPEVQYGTQFWQMTF